jgi:protein phosphatase
MIDPGQDTQDTVEFSLPKTFGEMLFAKPVQPFQIQFGAATHVGKVRPHNEDHYAVVKRSHSSKLLLSNLLPDDLVQSDDHAYSMVVADGVGGAKHGEFASRLAVQTMFELASQATSWVMRLTDLEIQQVQQRVEAYVDRIQGTLHKYCQIDPELAGMGTTWTSAHLLPPFAVVVHLGDSRAYVFRDGELNQITRDETMAQAFVDSGMDPDSVKRFGHVLLNGFGGSNDDISAQIHELRFEPGDQLLLCTDGLTDMVSDDEIARELSRNTAPQSTCNNLTRLALEHGGKDNVTVVLAKAMVATS